MSEKKRKRESEGESGHSRKKSTSTSNSATLTFKIAEAGKDELPPVLAVPSSIKIPSQSLKPYSRKLKDVPLVEQPLVLHTSAHPRLDFIGDENFGNDSAALLSHYIGIYDPETGKVELHKARRLKISTTLRPTQEQLDEAKIKKDYQTPYALRQQLGMEFGTKKAKTMIKSQAENAIIQAGSGDGRPDTTTQALLDSIGEKIASMPTAAEQAASATDSAPKPKADLSATESKDVYPLHVLIPQETLNSIDVTVWMEMAKRKEPISTGSRFVSYRVIPVATNYDLTKMKVLRYMLVMIELYISLKGGGKGARRLPPKKELMNNLKASPQGLIDAVLKRFCIASPKEMTAWEIDNLITHICALSLYIDDWESDTTNIKDDLRMDIIKVLPYFRELGCRTGGMTEKDRNSQNLSAELAKPRRMAKLIIPLEFPTLARGRAKGGRR